MIFKNPAIVVVLSAACLLLPACAGPSRSSGSGRGGKGSGPRPAWVDGAPAHSESTLYFVGGSGWRSSESVARQAAMVQASAQIAGYFGSLVSASSRDIQAASGKGDSSLFVLKTEIVGTTVTLRGIEQRAHWCRADVSGYECFVMVAYPVDEYRKAQVEISAAEARYRAHQAQNAARALDLFQSALRDESAGRFEEALASLQQCAGIIGDFQVTIDLDDRSIANTDILGRAAADALARVGSRVVDSAGWLAVGVVANVDQARSDDVEQKVFANVSGIARDCNLKTKAARLQDGEARACLDGDPSCVRMMSSGAAYLLVLDVNSRFSSETYGQYFARASGRWALLDAKSGRVAASGPFTDEKGSGVTRESACVNAVDRAWEVQILPGVTGALAGIKR